MLLKTYDCLIPPLDVTNLFIMFGLDSLGEMGIEGVLKKSSLSSVIRSHND